MSSDYDLLVVGGGIIGVATAWLASKRKLRVLLVEQEEKLASKTSANSHRIMHGGFRYLSNLDLIRTRESVIELNWMLDKFGPEIVTPLECVMPLNKLGLQSKYPIMAASKIYELLSIKSGGKIKSPRVVKNNGQYPELAHISDYGLVLWQDGLLVDHERLVEILVQEMLATGFAEVKYRSKVENFNSIDSGFEFNVSGSKIKTKAVITATNNNFKNIALDDKYPEVSKMLVSAVAFNLVLNRKPKFNGAFGAKSNSGQNIFVTPRPEGCAIGTAYHPLDNSSFPRVSEQDVNKFIECVQGVFKWSNINPKDVIRIEKGVIPVKKLEAVGNQWSPVFFGKSFNSLRTKNFIDIISTKYSGFRATSSLAVASVLK